MSALRKAFVQHQQVARAMAYLDRHGATFAAYPGFPGWFEARWADPDLPKEACRWCCQDAPAEAEQGYALAFRARVESQGAVS